MNVFVLNKKTFDDTMLRHGITKENVHEDKMHFFISILDSIPRDENDVPFFDEGPNVKILRFDDTEEGSTTSLMGTNDKHQAQPFTAEQAEDLLKFLDANKDKKTCIVHCSAGFSRSGAVGTFVNDYFGENWFQFKRINPQVQPNATVLRKLKAALVNKYRDDV